MDVRQLRYFVEVVEAKSFTKAAQRVHIAQPALGLQVRKLEDELGVQLLLRHSRGVEPTEAGHAMLRHAYSVLRQIEQAKQEIIDVSGPPRGAISLGITPTSSALLAAGMVLQCHTEYHEVSLNLIEGLSEQVMAWLSENRIDMGFTYNPSAVPGIKSTPLLVEDLFLVAADGAGLGKTTALSALADETLILPSRHYGNRDLVDQAAAENDVELEVAFEIDAVATTLELVTAGLGVTVLPFGAVRAGVKAGTLEVSRIVKPEIARTLHLGYSPGYVDSGAGRAVAQVIDNIVGERLSDKGGYWRPPGAK